MKFIENFVPELVIDSPGRINIIGEHTDYNMGYVLPTAISKKIVFKFCRNNSQDTCNVYSKTYDVGFTVNLAWISRSKTEWENYILGVLHEIGKRSDKLQGFDCVIDSNLPGGSGLSSSAALECGLAFGLNELFSLELSKRDIVELSQTAEHTYVGTQCGIMDQFASVMSKKDHVILLDCTSLEHNYIPVDFNPYKIIMLNTNVSHNLASSEYNVRKAECADGVAIIKKSYPKVNSLRDITRKMLEEHKSKMAGKVYDRCSFIIDENKRVIAAAEALKTNDFDKLGTLLYMAHDGLSRLYEVSCVESDFLVDFSKNNPNVLGARQTGGGFGGCVLNIVHESAVEDFVASASDAYLKKFNRSLIPFEAIIGPGTKVVSQAF
ncbi:galactokinase [Costertonia aggregata]|uniref:Galactokinase n=1 Tax=Costertonia aggregata TaxID=343403 RepID=A0A7H9ALN4_9FLAO|nr:galactokinase [Costertonia aggregata]QLG44368.1 galactokinase [Costertonia aggregata]